MKFLLDTLAFSYLLSETVNMKKTQKNSGTAKLPLLLFSSAFHLLQENSV